jgi:hypothetical protein
MSCGNNISSTHWDRLVELVTAKVCWKLGGAQLAGPARCIGSWKPVGGSGKGAKGALEAGSQLAGLALVTAKVCWKLGGAQLAGLARCIGSWKPVGGSGKGALEASWRVWHWKLGGAQLAGPARCIGSRKPVGGSVGTSQTAKSPNFWEIGQTGPFFVSKNAWHGLPP